MNLKPTSRRGVQICHDKHHSRKSIGFEEFTSGLATENSSIKDLTSTLAAEREKSSITPTQPRELVGLKRLDQIDLALVLGPADLQRFDVARTPNSSNGPADLQRFDVARNPRSTNGPADLQRFDVARTPNSSNGPADLKRFDVARTPRSTNGPEDLKRFDVARTPNTPNSTKRRRSALRTATRISRARDNDQKTLGTYLPGHHRAFVLAPIQGPDDSFRAPDWDWFFQEVSRLTSTPVPVPKSPPFLFDMSDASCIHNQNVLKSFEYDLKRVIDDNTGSTISFGSEFRPADQLRPLLSRHPLFDAMEKFIYHGMPYIFSRELTAEESLMELTASITRGNHKSATDENEQVKKLISKDVTHGFSVPFPASTVTLLPSPVVTPLGLAKQWTLDNKGDRVPKFRMTQDLSFSSSDPAHAISINKRIDMTSYPEMIYGWCFSRTLHFIASLRYHHPRRRILIAKYDFSDAYRRIAHSAQAAHQTISIRVTANEEVSKT